VALVNSISFSHRFSDDGVCHDTCSYQEINHTYSADTATAVARAFYQFMLGCGYAPSNVADAMLCIGTEYEEANGGNQYNGEKQND
jgi:hypothetical protein